jgi:hypothetical protein
MSFLILATPGREGIGTWDCAAMVQRARGRFGVFSPWRGFLRFSAASGFCLPQGRVGSPARPNKGNARPAVFGQGDFHFSGANDDGLFHGPTITAAGFAVAGNRAGFLP